jgi:hypothetical protein
VLLAEVALDRVRFLVRRLLGFPGLLLRTGEEIEGVLLGAHGPVAARAPYRSAFRPARRMPTRARGDRLVPGSRLLWHNNAVVQAVLERAGGRPHFCSVDA